MELILGKNECILGQWEYSRVEQGLNPSTVKSLTVTNRRIIHDVGSGRDFSRTEITKDDISSVDTYYANGIKKWALWVALICIALLIASTILLVVASSNPEGMAMIVISVALLVIALYGSIVFFVVYALSKKSMELMVVINKRCNEVLSFSCSASSLAEGKGKKKRRRKKNAMRVRIRVNHEVAREITETVSGLILNG